MGKDNHGSHAPAAGESASVQPRGKMAGPCALVIFGASGDLTKRKLLPALYNLEAQGLLPKQFTVTGVARRETTVEEFRRSMEEEVRRHAKVDEAVWAGLADRLNYLSGDFSDPAFFGRLRAALEESDRLHGTGGNYLFYLATASDFFAPIVEAATEAGLTAEANGSWRRVIVEKPFGRDLDSARALNARLQKAVGERQIYRIDHYLGKETVQNLMVLRFANGIFEPIWNRRYVDHVQITVGESLGVEKRGGYYDQSGALRDMVPNHILQLISLTAMEPPISFQADSVRDKQVDVLRSLKPMSHEDVLSRTVRGQYGAGGADIPGYRSEVSVPPDSTTETYVALKLFIDNWRWADVPFYIRTGKRLPCRATEIVIQFKQVPLILFRKTSAGPLPPNKLIVRIQPDEGISLSFQAKVPGPTVRMNTVDMNFCYHDYFGREASTGYERLLYDAMLGDATLFQRSDMVEAGWEAVSPLLDVWKALPPRTFPNYAAGTWGPAEADELLRRDGREWRDCSQ